MPWDRVPGQPFDALVGHPGRRGRLCARDPLGRSSVSDNLWCPVETVQGGESRCKSAA
jgi:hypothetical protein